MASTSGSKKIPTPSSFIPIDPPSPPSSFPESFPYDVFLSFRGRNTRNNFTGHLYDRLIMAGIRTFMDDDELPIGRQISLELMRAIEESRIYIVVFSQNYASSRWCLDELVKITNQCHNYRGRVLLPVFYDVEPSFVRWQRGTFEKDFRIHEANYVNQPDLVKSWRSALTHAAGYSGFELRTAFGSESTLISQILKEVLLIVKPKKLFVAKYPVGLDSCVNDVYSLIRPESNYHVQIIGIWGMGGSGKTVIAKALYNKILQSFDSSCFLANIREDSQQPNGLLRLQEYLISELLMQKNVKVGSIDRGIEIIRERLCLKTVLIVLDDLDKISQADALVGQRNWFGRGSVIIITTRDQQLLNQVYADETYKTKELNSEESLELFSWHAFKEGTPKVYYAAIVIRVVGYCCGLPLALVVLGSYLGGRYVRRLQEWNSTVESLQKFPPNEIQKILKISYDGLDNDEQRDIFLDIACFFIGTDIDYVTEILNGCGFSTEIGIGILIDRCLLTIDTNNELRMHDLLRDMGREIIRQQCCGEAGKRSRLWNHQDAIKVLMRNKGTDVVEGVTLVSPSEVAIHLSTMSFERMYKLRLLNMDKVYLDGGFEHLSKEIRWFRWQCCSLEHLPSGFEMPDLIVLDMQHNMMNTDLQDLDSVVNLKILNLSHSKCLTSTPNFNIIPSLTKLILEGCTSLAEIDPSIGCLDSLMVLNLKGCEKITSIPSEVCRLRLLGYLNVSGCSSLKQLPDKLGDIESLRELYAEEAAVIQLPYSFKYLHDLTTLSLRGCTQMRGTINALLEVIPSYIRDSALQELEVRPIQEKAQQIRRLDLRECNLCDDDIPYNIGDLSALHELYLAGNSLSKLPDSFRELTNLQSLSLDNWSIVQAIPNLPPNLAALLAKNITASTEIVGSVVDDDEEAEISSYQIQDEIKPNVELHVKERRESLVRK